MHCSRRLGVLIGIVAVSVVVPIAQTPPSLVREVRTAVACTSWPCTPKQDFSAGEAILKKYRTTRGTTSEALEALSWLGRAALAARNFDKAEAYAAETYRLAVAALERTRLADDPRLEIALGAAIEVQAQAGAERGQRSEAVSYLRREMGKFKDTRVHRRIQKNILLLSLEGQPAPALEAGTVLGPPMPSVSALKGKVVLLFFWAHWCPDCKSMSPVLSQLADRYQKEGLVILAPTQRYGYAARGTPANPDDELRYISQIRDTYYPFLRTAPVPVSEANHTQFGVTTTPTLVVVDRLGIVRLYHPGTMTEGELRSTIEPLL
jgi:thiol-disulfide isomerase/thioredoxin